MRVADIDRPEVRDDGLLIRIVATSINRSDWEALAGSPAFVRIVAPLKPREPVLGSDIAGVVEAVGPEVVGFAPGDEVFADTIYHGKGGFAEYASVPVSTPLAIKPAAISFEQAATLPQAAVLGLQGLREKGGAQSGQHVLINGAGGGGGTFAIQLAKSYGAEVTGVDNVEKLDTMKAAGADHVIDHRAEDYTKSDQRYDRIIDFVGSQSLFANRRVLEDEGVYLIVGGTVRRILLALIGGWVISKTSRRRMGVLMAKPNGDDLAHVADLVAEGRLEPMIDRVYGLDEVPEAMRRLGEDHSLGKLVVRP
jgi:NADPH:quinone reductase-like Zn-dependent oxidoreductase